MTNKGITVVEVLVAVAVILIIVLGIITSFSLLLSRGLMNVERTQAAYLAEEGVEAVKFARDVDYDALSALTLDTEYHLEFVDMVWTATTTEMYIDNEFERTFTLSAVYRDGNDDIAASGTLDTGTFLLQVDVRWWNGASTSTESMSTYITDLFDE